MQRLSIYQLFTRHFSNHVEQQTYAGSREENGCGTFSGITTTALQEIARLGANVVWFTGILDHATSEIWEGAPADPDSLLKGRAGSPYAVRNYYDVAPSLADDPRTRLDEFRALIARTQAEGLRVMIDFIPNHVARSYNEQGQHAEGGFGANDDASVFFSPQNDFYYLPDATETRLPCGATLPADYGSPRVTGNNVLHSSPSREDWYETVKLNYGYDFTLPREQALDALDARLKEGIIPPVWDKMRDILQHWAAMGVDGVRCDMAHMVPVAFWRWVIAEIRADYPEFLFVAEAYAEDPMGCLPTASLAHLTEAGFSAYYDQEFYHQLKAVVEGRASIQELTSAFFSPARQQYGIRYVENHDEVRAAAVGQFGTDGQNLAATAAAWLTGQGPVLLYNGQEVAEPAAGATGFSADDGRSSIYDYTALPALQRWTNGGHYDGAQLTPHERRLRSQYAALLNHAQHPVYTTGHSYGLNYLNPHLDAARVFCFLRYTADGEHLHLIALALGDAISAPLEVHLPSDVWEHLGSSPHERSATSVLEGRTVPYFVSDQQAHCVLTFPYPVQIIALSTTDR